jgi:hypothetical protein
MTTIARAMALLLGLGITLAVAAEPSANARREIDYLLGFIENSGCEFNRNGSWHDAKAARDHIRFKYDYVLARDGINTTEDFIEKAATKSSMWLGQPYTVKCNGGPPVPSSRWLSAELTHFRTLSPKAPL